jgi:hypothetical protein
MALRLDNIVSDLNHELDAEGGSKILERHHGTCVVGPSRKDYLQGESFTSQSIKSTLSVAAPIARKTVMLYEIRYGSRIECWLPLNSNTYLGSRSRYPRFRKLAVYEAVAHSAYNIWYTLVIMFSGRQLMFESDKLPAISALAIELGALLKDNYLFGLWSNDLVRGLIWQPNIINMSQGYPRVSKGGLYQAPSWSWAAYNGGVSYYSNALSRNSRG